jgi:hypothetical protein
MFRKLSLKAKEKVSGESGYSDDVKTQFTAGILLENV